MIIEATESLSTLAKLTNVRVCNGDKLSKFNSYLGKTV